MIRFEYRYLRKLLCFVEEAEERYARLEGVTPVLQLLTGTGTSHSLNYMGTCYLKGLAGFGIRIRIGSTFLETLDPDPRLMIQLEIQKFKFKIKRFVTFLKKRI